MQIYSRSSQLSHYNILSKVKLRLNSDHLTSMEKYNWRWWTGHGERERIQQQKKCKQISWRLQQKVETKQKNDFRDRTEQNKTE